MFSGIVIGTGKVHKISHKEDNIFIEVSPPKGFNKNLKKGASVSVDGVCLTSLDDGLKKLNQTIKRKVFLKFTLITQEMSCLRELVLEVKRWLKKEQFPRLKDLLK